MTYYSNQAGAMFGHVVRVERDDIVDYYQFRGSLPEAARAYAAQLQEALPADALVEVYETWNPVPITNVVDDFTSPAERGVLL